MLKTILIANTAEAFEKLLKKIAHTERGVCRIRHELTLSQRAFFWEDDHKIVITPFPIPEPLLRHNTMLCGFTEVVNLWSVEPTIGLSRAVIEDHSVMGSIIRSIHGSPEIQLSPYAVTDAFLLLFQMMHRANIGVTAKEIPVRSSRWILSYLDSKLGFRTEMQKLAVRHPSIRIPEGFVAGNKKEAASITEWFYTQGRSTVVKANHGESGWGFCILKAGEYSNTPAWRKKVREVLSTDPIWSNTLLIVEELIEMDTEVAGGSPSVELLIDGNGPLITYSCGQLLDRNGGFRGVEIGRDTLPPSLRGALEQNARIIGERYYALGYRGFCDVDFVVGKDGSLYAVETNLRRTGGTHVYDLAKHLFGTAWEREAYFLSHDSFSYGTDLESAGMILERIQPLLYPMNGERKGVIITSINPWDPEMGYVIVAADPDEGRMLQRQLLERFEIVQ